MTTLRVNVEKAKLKIHFGLPSSNRYHSENDIFLLENEKLISSPHEVANTLNDFYVNVAANIGNSDTDTILQNLNKSDFVLKPIEINKDHPSILEIGQNGNTTNFAFSQISFDDVLRVIENTQTKKSTGYDTIPAKILLLSKSYINRPIAVSSILPFYMARSLRLASLPL